MSPSSICCLAISQIVVLYIDCKSSVTLRHIVCGDGAPISLHIFIHKYSTRASLRAESSSTTQSSLSGIRSGSSFTSLRLESAWFTSTGPQYENELLGRHLRQEGVVAGAGWEVHRGEAKKTIMKDRPDVKNIEVFPVGTPVTGDFRPDRVRIFVDTVAETPRIG
nr:uncharacterized protein LOC109757333 [Aegilops tauschii subsp. strangulata]